jgi:GAF domain-containing protein
VAIEADERRVLALVRVGRAMASTADYEQALATLIRTISELLDSESAGFMLYDPERSELVLQQPAFGMDDPEVIRAYHVPLRGGGNAVQVFLTRRPYLTNHADEDPRLIQRFVRMFGARQSMTVPLVVEDRAIGICHAINKREGQFTEDDLHLFELIAPMLAVSVQSARMFRDVREQRRQLERAIFLQRELTRTAFEAPGMASLTERLATIVDRPVMVCDPALRTLASARWPDGSQPDEDWLQQGQGEHWWRQEAGRGGRPALAPIVVGSHFGGYLAVLDAERPLDRIDARAIEHAATMFVLEMLRERTAYELESRLKGDMVQALFSGAYGDERDAHRVLADLGYTVAGPYRIAQLGVSWRSPASADWTDEVQDPRIRLYPALQQLCVECTGGGMVVPWRSGFLFMLPANAGDAEQDLRLADHLVARVLEAAGAIRAGAQARLAFSAPLSAASALAQGHREAEQAFAAAKALQIVDRPVLFEHLGVYRVLLGGGGPRQHLAFVDQALGPLVRYDAEHGTELVGTLRSYVAADYNAAETARRLFVHANTLAYRLKTIRRLLGADPCRGELRLQIELAFKLRELSRLPSPAS